MGDGNELLFTNHTRRWWPPLTPAARRVLGDALVRRLGDCAVVEAPLVIPQGLIVHETNARTALCLFLGRTLTAEYEGLSWLNERVVSDPGTVAPLEMWVLTKLTSCLGLPMAEQGPGWIFSNR